MSLGVNLFWSKTKYNEQAILGRCHEVTEDK